MAMEEINSLRDLYNMVLPALKTRTNELKRNKINFINEKQIWHYLKENVWSEEENLTLFDMVSDILSVKEIDLIKYQNELRENNE